MNSVVEFIAFAKANPGKLNFGSARIGNQTHLNGEVFKAKTGLDLVHVPYKSGSDILSGEFPLISEHIGTRDFSLVR